MSDPDAYESLPDKSKPWRVVAWMFAGALGLAFVLNLAQPTWSICAGGFVLCYAWSCRTN